MNPNQHKCRDCAHFRQHYVPSDAGLLRAYCGHCVHTRVRNKRPDADVCNHFTPGTPDVQCFIHKEHLSNLLMRCILELELLPEIKNWVEKQAPSPIK